MTPETRCSVLGVMVVVMLAAGLSAARAEGPETLRLEPQLEGPPYWVAGSGTVFSIDIVLTDIDPAHPILGANLNVEWGADPCWTFVSILPGEGFNPFGEPVVGPGFVRHSVIRDLGAPGIVDPQAIAVVTFQSTVPPGGCCTDEVGLTAGSGASATRLLGEGGYVSYPFLGPPKEIAIDAEPPAITCPADVVIEWDESSDPADTGQASAMDTCSGVAALTYEDDIVPGPSPNEWVIHRIWLAWDIAGNTEPCDQVITVVDTAAPWLTSAVSRRAHGQAGDLDIALPLDPPEAAGVETRLGGVRRVVLTFSEPVQAVDGVPDGSEVDLTCDGTPCGSVDAVTIFGDEMTVDVSGVPDETCLAVTLDGLADLAGHPPAGDNDVHVQVLAGNTNSDGKTDLTDMAQVQDKNGASLEPATARFDVNVDGQLTLTDMAAVRSLNGGEAWCP